jgi:hypothetical protein
MTAPSMVRCSYCCTTVPADQTFTPVTGGTYSRCKDERACTRRQDSAFDPSILADEDLPVPPPVVPGARCAICGTVDPPGGVYAGAAYMCLDRAGCEQRAAVADLAPWTDFSPDQEIAHSGAHLRMPLARPVVVPAEQAPLSYEERQALAASESLGRKRR